MGIVTRQAWKCDRCDHEWLSRDNEKPLRCASCKSPYWNTPRRDNKKSVEQAREAKKLKRKRQHD